jgi:hypothetical protein
LKAFENRALRGILGPQREDVIEGGRKLHNREHHNACSSPNVIRIAKSRRMRWERHIARVGMRNPYRVLVGKPDGNRPLGRPRLRLQEYIKTNFTEIEWGRSYELD